MQPAAPGCWASVPSKARSNTTTASLTRDETYTVWPSGLTATVSAPSSAAPSPHGAAPLSEMQPAAPGFWASVPFGPRSNTTTASLPIDAT